MIFIHTNLVHKTESQLSCIMFRQKGLSDSPNSVGKNVDPIGNSCKQVAKKVTMNKHIAGDLYFVSKKETSFEIFLQNLVILS